MLRLSAQIRRAVGRDYSLGAIVPDSIGQRYWPNFPYKGLAHDYDVFIPMGYFTYRAREYQRVRAYTAANIAHIRQEIANRDVAIHATTTPSRASANGRASHPGRR